MRINLPNPARHARSAARRAGQKTRIAPNAFLPNTLPSRARTTASTRPRAITWRAERLRPRRLALSARTSHSKAKPAASPPSPATLPMSPASRNRGRASPGRGCRPTSSDQTQAATARRRPLDFMSKLPAPRRTSRVPSAPRRRSPAPPRESTASIAAADTSPSRTPHRARPVLPTSTRPSLAPPSQTAFRASWERFLLLVPQNAIPVPPRPTSSTALASRADKAVIRANGRCYAHPVLRDISASSRMAAPTAARRASASTGTTT